MRILNKLLIILGLILISENALAAFDIKEFVTAKGIRVRYREDKSTPVISMNFSIECGSLYDPIGKEGTATLYASMLTEGTRTKTEERLSSLLQDLAISLGYEADSEYFQGHLTTLRKNKDKAFALIKETLFDSAFEKQAFERAREEILSLLAMKSVDPSYQVSQSIRQLIFKNHPLSRPSLGTVESIKKIKIEELKKFAQLLNKKSLLVSIAGNISPKEIEQHIDEVFGDLPADASLSLIENPQIDIRLQKQVLKHKIPQTLIGLAQKGLNYKDEKYLAYVILNWIVSENLRLIVREQQGLSYQVGTYPQSTKKYSLLLGICGTKNESAQQAVNSILEVIRAIKEKGVTDQQFADAKAFLTGSYILNFQDTPSIANAILGLMQIERAPEHMDIRNDLMRKVTKEEVENLAKEILDPEHTLLVFYGDPKGINSDAAL